jgi:N12 class adenine-specific DNA methylase
MEASETEIATYLTIRAQNIELLGLAAKIAGCSDPKVLLNDVDTEATMRRLHEIFAALEEWVDPDEADEDVE